MNSCLCTESGKRRHPHLGLALILFALAAILQAAAPYTFTDPVRIAGLSHIGSDIQATGDKSGNLAVIWRCGDAIFFSRSTDNGRTWSAPSALTTVGITPALAMERESGAVYVTWTYRADDRSPLQVFMRRSMDGGRVWEEAVPVLQSNHRDDGFLTATVFHDVYSDTLYLAHMSSYAQGTMSSTDHGRTWRILHEESSQWARSNRYALRLSSAATGRLMLRYTWRYHDQVEYRESLVSEDDGRSWCNSPVTETNCTMLDKSGGINAMAYHNDYRGMAFTHLRFSRKTNSWETLVSTNRIDEALRQQASYWLPCEIAQGRRSSILFLAAYLQKPSRIAVYRSTDWGRKWSEASAIPFSSPAFTLLSLNSNLPAVIYAGEDGLYFTRAELAPGAAADMPDELPEEN